ncbi:phasin family protein [bacterium]|nr:phasin family protein [bacterium]
MLRGYSSMLLDLLKKTLWTGIGAAALTEKRAKEIVKGLMEAKEISEKEGETLLEELLKQGEKTKKEIEGFVEARIHAIIERLELATKADIEELKQKIDSLASKPKD